MLKVADVNRKRVGRRFQETATATPRVTGILRRAMGTELAVGVAVIGITAAMVVSPPAVAQQDENVATASSSLPEGGEVSATTIGAAIATIDGAITTPSTAPVAAPAVTCILEPILLTLGSSGEGVTCLQQALTSQGVYSGEMTGQFDQATDDAVRALQQQRGLAVDGIVGQQTASALRIWPQT